VSLPGTKTRRGSRFINWSSTARHRGAEAQSAPAVCRGCFGVGELEELLAAAHRPEVSSLGPVDDASVRAAGGLSPSYANRIL